MVRLTRFLWLLPWMAGGAAQADPSALWTITHDRCVPNQRANNDPAPCVLVDLTAGYVVLKDLVGATQFLLMPVARLGGVESPEILTLDAPNYWDLAWQARRFSEARAGRPLPREAMSLTINSWYGRSQDQLHIHIDCVREDVRDALAMHRGRIGFFWDGFPVPLTGRRWRAIRVDGENLNQVNPFRLLAGDTGAGMARYTLAVIGMTYDGNQPGFAVLSGEADLFTLNRATAEQLQDHDCALARSTALPSPSAAPPAVLAPAPAR